jgi:hypothetical protein
MEDGIIQLGYNVTGELTETAHKARERLLGAIELEQARVHQQMMDHLLHAPIRTLGVALMKEEGSGVIYGDGLGGWEAHLAGRAIRRALYRSTAHVVSLRYRNPALYAIRKKITRARHWLADRVIDIAENHIGGQSYDRETSGGW